MCIHHSVIDSVCIRECPTRWCCSNLHFSSPPVGSEDIREIEKAGIVGFYERSDTGARLKCRSDGYCLFFDADRKICDIYPMRPPDCRIFPFDYFATDAEHGEWVIWDCPYSRRMDTYQIHLSLHRFETDPVCVRHILGSWNSGNETYTADSPAKRSSGFRRLRSIRIFKPEASAKAIPL